MKYIGCLSILLLLLFLTISLHFHITKKEGFSPLIDQITSIMHSTASIAQPRKKKNFITLNTYKKYCNKRPTTIKAKRFIIDPLTLSNSFTNTNLTLDKPTYRKWKQYKNKEGDIWIPPLDSVCPKGCEPAASINNVDDFERVGWVCNNNQGVGILTDEHCNPLDETSCYGCDICPTL
tara:strand:- start:198 stop:731 length:534 start_codon:yes stop_codon:yes gene_type:complete